jgi:hypothetical protein
MLLAALAATALKQSTGPSYRILFLGNSHTQYNDLTGKVAGLLRSAGGRVEFAVVQGAHLDDLSRNPAVLGTIDKDKWTHVVLQGAMISSSHKYDYSQEPGIALAARAKKAGSKALLFAEWPRKGWDESDYIYKHYAIIQKAAGGEIVPVCYAWDAAMKASPKLEMWAGDGNHSNDTGAYLAACTIAYWIAGPDAKFKPITTEVDQKTNALLMKCAQDTVRTRKKG